ncbi:unnamed protein product [Onchocerca flexuosa]|uniref:CST complex subunit CTC1 n=1 Tax=Onchocerca flexuosa TaxID=387005 RepID=A0A183I023_9BILA|nr:unnamed protein product [Onchocerca flexuosa]
MEEGNLLKADDRFCVHQHCSCLHASAIKYNLETTINVYSVNESSFSMREQPVLQCPVEVPYCIPDSNELSTDPENRGSKIFPFL